jgi:hypothetical protein
VRRLAVLVVGAALAGCASSTEPADVQRAAQGPTADEIHTARFASDYGRLPTFEESVASRAELEDRVSAYLSRHPEISTSPRASQFTFYRRAAVGMSREEVTLLLGPPFSVTREPAAMAKAAAQFWPGVGQRAQEMWAYPGQWYFFFAGDRLVDITVTGKPPL